MSYDYIGSCLLLLVRTLSVHHASHDLRWLNTFFDTSVSFTFSSKSLDPLVAKMQAMIKRARAGVDNDVINCATKYTT